MFKGKITEYHGEDSKGNRIFTLILPPEKETNYNPSPVEVSVAHDYVEFETSTYIHQERLPGKGLNYPYKSKNSASNLVQVDTSVQISIKDIIEIILPYLNEHKYCQKKHIEDSVHRSDDEYFKNYDLEEPRFKAGDPCPSYAHSSSIVKLWENGEPKYILRRAGEKDYYTMTEEEFKVIEDNIHLGLNKYMLKKYESRIAKKTS